MNEASIPWIDIVSPVVTFALVIVVPVAIAIWVVYRTLSDKPALPEASGDDSGTGTAAE